MDLRRKLIREVLDRDKNINKQVSYIQFKNAPKNEVALLHHQMDPEEAQKLGIFVSSLRRRWGIKATPLNLYYLREPSPSRNTS